MLNNWKSLSVDRGFFLCIIYFQGNLEIALTSGISGEEGLRPLRTDKSLQINNRISDDKAKILHPNRLRGAMGGSFPIE